MKSVQGVALARRPENLLRNDIEGVDIDHIFQEEDRACFGRDGNSLQKMMIVNAQPDKAATSLCDQISDC